MDIYNIVGPPTSIKQRRDSALNDIWFDSVLQVYRRVRDDEIVMTKDYLTMIPVPTPDMSWTNKDWMLVYGALKEHIMLLDLELHRVGHAQFHMSDQQDIVLELIKKLEYMFREHDGASKES